ncbi:MAG: hypothetical protein ACFE9C_08445 [Candidatus Hodarchaeota archaeon]
MTVSKKIVVPEFKDNEELVMDDLSNFKMNKIPKKKPKKTIITISTYSYGSSGLQWHYFSKLLKKK